MMYMFENPKEYKAKKIIEYFTDSNRIDVTDLNYESAVKLDQMIMILNSETDSLNKYYQMKRLVKDSKSLYKEYECLKEVLHESTARYIYQYVNDIARFLQHIENNLPKETEKELLKLEKENCFDDYPYAAYFVKEFIDYNESPYLKDFLMDKGLFESDFNRFLYILYKLDDSLYEKYLDKVNNNKLLRKVDVIRKVDNIRSGVTTGYTTDGIEFDSVEFYCNLPFNDQDSSLEILEDFNIKKTPSLDRRIKSVFDALCPTDAREITNYIYENKLMYGNPVRINENEIKNTKFILNGIELSDEGKKQIIEYMKKRNIPFYLSAFNAVKSKYLSGNLQLEDEKTIKK